MILTLKVVGHIFEMLYILMAVKNHTINWIYFRYLHYLTTLDWTHFRSLGKRGNHAYQPCISNTVFYCIIVAKYTSIFLPWLISRSLNADLDRHGRRHATHHGITEDQATNLDRHGRRHHGITEDQAADLDRHPRRHATHHGITEDQSEE